MAEKTSTNPHGIDFVRARLPVVHVLIEDYQLECATDGRDFGVFAPNQFQVDYEPAVPRCRTCEHFHLAKYMPGFKVVESEQICRHRDGLKNVPQDGSGYCPSHPDAKKEI